jgi:rare lipoprotein A
MSSRRGNTLIAIRAGAALAACLSLANCASQDKFARKVDPKYGVATSPRVVAEGDRAPKGGGVYRIGKPYVVAGRTFVPEEDTSYKSEGLASWYGRDFHGRLTANGEVFDQESITAAHPTLPMPSYVRVTNLANRKSLIVRVNDRGPFHGDRVIDLSHKSAQLLGFKDNGVARVRVEYVGRAALEGSDDMRLAATLRQGEPAPPPVLVASAGKPMIALPEQPRVAYASASQSFAGQSFGGSVPVPSGRPYNLGEAQTPGFSEVTAVGRNKRQTSEDTPRRAVSARSPLRYDSQAGVISGRGLY